MKVGELNVHYRDEGNQEDSIPLIFLHGTGSSLHTFDDWVSALKSERRIVRLDLPAFGLTGPFPDRNYSINHYVEFLDQFLTQLGIKECVLAGNSLGGQIAGAFTIQHPEMVEKLVLIDAAGYRFESKSAPIAFRLARMPVINKLLTFITPKFMARASVENVYFDKSKVSDSLVDRYFDLTLRAGNRQALVDRLTSNIDTFDIKDIRYLKQPTLILWGDQDMLIPVANAYRFHDDLPNDTLIILNQVGHVPMEEAPHKSLDAIMAFLKK
jgi:pimeloyl-ACP methyl ester carboxylesterase